jgi:CubicO group peptidase (beta-lactamase class C family)
MSPITPKNINAGPPQNVVVPRMDWDRPPWNRWAFQHIREILPTVEVWRGASPLQPLPQQPKNLDALSVKNLAGQDISLAEFLEVSFADGFIVLHKGSVVYERYFNGMTPRTLHLSQSVAKSFTGVLVGIFVERGVLNVASPVTDYLPELQHTAWAGASLQQVLDMTTGVKFDETYTDPHSDIGQMDVATGWKPIPADCDPALKWPAHVWAQILKLKHTTRPHGAQFEYRSVETDVLAFVLERVTGKRLAQILSEELWQNMGAAESACYTVDPAGYALADGGLNACLRDYARFGQLLLAGGGGLIPKAWIDATRNADHKVFGAPYSYVLPDGAYHNQFWVEDSVSRNLMARGVFGQLIYIDFAHDMVVAKMSSWPDFVNPKMMKATLVAVHSIAESL